MKKKSMLSLLLSMMLAFIMCLAFGGSAYAADAPAQLSSGSTVPLTQIKNVDSIKTAYSTPVVTNTYQTFDYTVKMPKKGTLFIFYAPTPGANCYINEVTGAVSAGSGTENDTEYRMYYVSSAGSVKVKLTVSAWDTSGVGVFAAGYMPAAKTVKAGKTAMLGSPSSGGISTVKVKVPSTGYLKVTATNGINSSYSVSMNTKGFKNWEYLGSSNNNSSYVGVKKGTYTIKLKGAAVYGVKISFTKVKETSARTTKARAASMTKNKLNKAVIPVNKKKVHWYKIRNPKNQKMTLYVNAKKLSDGGSIGSIKITVYFPDKKSSYTRAYAGDSGPIKIKYGRIGTEKARAGTYYVKVESNDGGNGYYTLKWK